MPSGGRATARHTLSGWQRRIVPISYPRAMAFLLNSLRLSFNNSADVVRYVLGHLWTGNGVVNRSALTTTIRAALCAASCVTAVICASLGMSDMGGQLSGT